MNEGKRDRRGAARFRPMTAPRCRWSLELRALFVATALLAAIVGFFLWQQWMIRNNDRAAIGDAILHGRLEKPESLRGGRHFSDAELDALMAESKQRAAGLPPEDVFRP